MHVAYQKPAHYQLFPQLYKIMIQVPASFEVLEARHEPGEVEAEFVMKRAFRSPDRCVVRKDLLDAFGMRETKATNLLSDMARMHAHILRRDGNKIVPIVVEPPPVAGEADLLSSIDRGQTDFWQTGLRSDELQLNYFSFSANRPAKSGVLWQIVRACGSKRSLMVEYVGVKRGDAGDWRRFVPLCLERMGDQWRVTGHDLNSNEGAGGIRTLVLARILDSRPDHQPLPKGFVRGNPNDSTQSLPVVIDARYTKSQRLAIAHELRIKDATSASVEIPSRCVHEFGIRFAAEQPSESAIWPPLTLIRR